MSEWTDDDGVPLGRWVVIDQPEWRALVGANGGLGALTVFSSLTDLEGVYGPPQVYTSWGIRGENVPLVDVREYRDDEGHTERTEFKKFERRAAS